MSRLGGESARVGPPPASHHTSCLGAHVEREPCQMYNLKNVYDTSHRLLIYTDAIIHFPVCYTHAS